MTDARPKVSVVVPTFNGQRLLARCLESLQRQTRRPTEIIVVDDASTDDTPEWLVREWPAVHLVRRAVNGGYAAAVNDGVIASTGEIVAVLNDDLELAEDGLAEWLAGLEAIPPMSIAAAKILFAESRATLNSAGLAPGPSGHSMDLGYGLPDGEAWDRRRLVFGASGAALLVRREVFDRVGLFDSGMFMYYEDVEWAFRAQGLGYACRFVPTARAYHVEGASRGTLPRPPLFYHARNRLRVVLTHYTWPMLLRFGPSVAWATLRQLVGDVVRRRTLSSWFGVAAALGGLPRVWRRRRLIQRARRGRANDVKAWLRANARETAVVDPRWREARRGPA